MAPSYLTAAEHTAAIESIRDSKAIGLGPVTTAKKVMDLLGVDHRSADHRALRAIIGGLVRSEGVE